MALVSLLVLATLFACATSGPSAKQKKAMVDSHTEIAQQYFLMGELDRAEGQTLKGLELDPGNTMLKMIRGKILLKRGRVQDVQQAELIFRGIQTDGDSRSTLGLATALERKGMAFDEAGDNIESGKRVTEAPDPGKRAAELRDSARRLWEESAANYAKALQQFPGNVEGLSGLIRVNAFLERKAESLAWSEKLIESLQTDLDYWEHMLTRPDLSADDEERFRARVRQLSNLLITTEIGASIVLHDLSRDAQAVAHLDAAEKLDPERAEIFSRRAELQKELGRCDQAILDIDTFLRLSTKTLAHDHPDVLHAWSLRRECEDSLRTAHFGK